MTLNNGSNNLIRILDEIKNVQNEKDKVIKEENELHEKFKEFSNSFDKKCKEFYNYFSSIQNNAIMDDEIRKKIFEISKSFNKNISFKTMNELIDDTL